MTQADAPLWRSLMFVPANVDRFVDKAHTRGADGIIIDLEDSVIPAEKANARTLVPDVAAKVGRAGADVLVRINRPWRLAVPDLEAVIAPVIEAIMLPKVADAGHIRAIAEIIDELEAERGMAVGTTRLIAMIETADALFHARDIAGASPRIAAMLLGSEDFSLDMGMEPEPEGLFQPTMQTAVAARAAGIVPLGFIGSIAGFADRDAFRQIVRRANKLGFEGACCIHPAQVDILNQEFAPSADEIDHAKRVIAAFDKAQAEGRGAFEMDGKMIDIPIVERARRAIARQAAIDRRHGVTT